VSVDSYMNIQLSETVEHIDGKPTGTLGMVLIRCVFSCRVFVSCAILHDYNHQSRWSNGTNKALMGRCNNVLWISADSPGKAENGDTEMRE